MRNYLICGLIASASLVHVNSAHAADLNGTGPYGGMALGISRFNVDKGASPTTSNDVEDGSLKLYGGYQFTKTFGAEIGYLRTGDIVAKRVIGGVERTQTAQTRAFYVAGTARLPISNSVAINGRLGVARGKVDSDDAMPVGDTLVGTKTSAMIGVGVQYQVLKNLAVVTDFDRVHKQSDRVSSNTLTVGVRANF